MFLVLSNDFHIHFLDIIKNIVRFLGPPGKNKKKKNENFTYCVCWVSNRVNRVRGVYF